MLHFTGSDDQSDDNFSFRRSSDPFPSSHSAIEKLEALKRDFLPKSLALHISLAKGKPPPETPQARTPARAGLGLGAMVLGAQAGRPQRRTELSASDAVEQYFGGIERTHS